MFDQHIAPLGIKVGRSADTSSMVTAKPRKMKCSKLVLNVLKEEPQFHSRQLTISQYGSVFLISVHSFALHETRESQLL